MKRKSVESSLRKYGAQEKLYYFDVLFNCHHAIILQEPEPATGDTFFCDRCDKTVEVLSAFLIAKNDEQTKYYNSNKRHS